MLKRNLVALACSVLVPLSAAPAAAAADHPQRGEATVRILERPENRLKRSIDAHLELEAERRERRERRQERRERRQERREARIAEREAAEAAEAAQAAEAAEVPDSSETGVASSTLESIAACESGGDPGAVNPAGYYGKYQFDIGTWQSVGGTGNPAEAPESEQDYRAGLLYEQAGASPWPVCGS